MKLILTFTFILCLSVVVSGQSYMGSGNYNRVGIQAKYATLDLNTTNFESEGDGGFQAGLTTRGRLYNNLGMVYGIDLVSLKTNVQGRALGTRTFEEMPYEIIGAQLNILLSYNIIGQYLAIDAGPALLVNSKMKLKQNGQADNIVKGYASLKATDLEEISRINGFAIVALTGGFERLRFKVQYQYGFTNMLNNLNEQDLTTVDSSAEEFSGNPSVIAAGVVFYF